MTAAESLHGQVTTGIGQGTSFTQLPWARNQFISELGIDPYPGTLNLSLSGDNQATWDRIKATPGYRVDGSAAGACDARCYPVLINQRFAGAIVYPEVESYPSTQVEIIAAIPLREHLGVVDDDPVQLELSYPISAKAVIFDVDGTLVDTIETFRVLAEISGKPYIDSISREHICESLNTGSFFWDSVLPADLRDRDEVVRGMITKARQLWPAALAEHGRLYAGVESTLAGLKEAGAIMAIVTGGESTSVLNDAGLGDYFDVVIGNDDVEERKPHPEGLLKCIAELGVAPHEAVYVGDSLIDVQASVAANISCFGVLTGAGTSASLCVGGATGIVHSHAELQRALEIR